MLRLASIAAPLLLGACGVSGPVPPPGDATLYVMQTDWHTDIGIPVGEIEPPLSVLVPNRPGLSYVSFGFGEREYLIGPSQDGVAAAKALLPGDSALMVTGRHALLDPSMTVTLHLSHAAVNRIEAAIWHELTPPPNGKPVPLTTIESTDYYASHDTYSGLFTCNSWISETLRAGGVPMPSALFAGQVMDAARAIERQQAAQNPR